MATPNHPQPHNDELAERLLTVRRALFVGAHPDDIEFYCGGLVQLMRASGTQVTFAVATRGGRGRRGRLKALLEGLRTRHQEASAAILGGVRVVFFDYPDGSLQQSVEPFVADLLRLIEIEKPDVILSWDPDFIYNPHPDHVAAALAARTAAAGSSASLVHYGTRQPNLWIGYDGVVFRTKLRALRAHKTETPWPYSVLMKRRLTARGIAEGSKIGAEFAEALRVANPRRTIEGLEEL